MENCTFEELNCVITFLLFSLILSTLPSYLFQSAYHCAVVTSGKQKFRSLKNIQFFLFILFFRVHKPRAEAIAFEESLHSFLNNKKFSEHKETENGNSDGMDGKLTQVRMNPETAQPQPECNSRMPLSCFPRDHVGYSTSVSTACSLW